MSLIDLFKRRDPEEVEQEKQLRKLRAHLDKSFKREHNTLLREMHQAWFLQEAFYLGHHYVSWDGSKWHLRPPRAPAWRVRTMDNRIQSYIVTTLAKVMRHKPRWEVIPHSGEDEDRNAARIGKVVLEHLWQHLNMDDIYERTVLHALVYGTAFTKVVWNPLGGTQFHAESMDRNSKPVASEPDQPIKTSMSTGEIQVESVPPQEILAPLGVEDLQESPWVIHARYMSIEDIDLSWPIETRFEEEEVAPETISAPFLPNTPSEHTSQLSSLLSEEEDLYDKGAIVKEYWERPCRAFPKGRYAIFANGVMLVYQEKLPFGLTNYPIFKVVDLLVPRRFFGRSRLADLIPLNKQMNRTLSQMIEAKNLMSKPKWKVPKGSGISATSITSQPGEVIEYNASVGPGPEMIVPAPLPNYVPKIYSLLEASFFDVSGLHEVSRASVPPGVESGVAIQFLQEQDDTRLAPFIRRIDRMFARMGKQMLQLVRKHYKNTRTIKVVGGDRPVEVLKFTGSDLRNNTDVRVVMTAGLPEGKTAKQEFVLRMYQAGLLGPIGEPDTIKKVLGYLEFGDEEQIFREEMADIRLAKRETDEILAGGTPTVHPLHNPIVHIREHSRPIRSGEITDPRIIAVLEAHIQEHEEVLLNIQEAAGPNQIVGQQQSPQGTLENNEQI